MGILWPWKKIQLLEEALEKLDREAVYYRKMYEDLRADLKSSTELDREKKQIVYEATFNDDITIRVYRDTTDYLFVIVDSHGEYGKQYKYKVPIGFFRDVKIAKFLIEHGKEFL